MRYLFVLLLITGCATQPAPQYRWVHDSGAGTQASLDRDFGQCEAQALGAHPLTPTDRGLQIFMGCMAGRGWRMVAR
jgi:hypothetical protein